MRNFSLFLGLTLCALVLATSCTSTEPAPIEEPRPQEEPKTIQDMILAGKYEEVKESLQIQQNIDAVDNKGNTVLHAAAMANNDELVTLFISMGASTELKNNDSDTALHLAVKNHSVKTAQTLSAVVIENIIVRINNI